MLFDREQAPKVLSDEQEGAIHDQAMRILEEIGIDVLHEEARKRFEHAGQSITEERVRLDREFVMEQVRKAPRTLTLHARNPANTVEVGAGTPLWMNVGGPPFFSDLDEGR